MIFDSEFLNESNLVFGDFKEEKDPRLGLKYHGPYRYETESVSLSKVSVGIIGDSNTIEKVKKILDLIKKPIENKESNKWLYPPYPGMSKDTKFNCSIDIAKNWQETVQQYEIEKIKNIIDVNERIGSAVELYLSKIKNIMADDNPPEVIICCLPKEIEEYCGISLRTRGAKIVKTSELGKKIDDLKKKSQMFLTEWGVTMKSPSQQIPKGYDFRNALKGKVMSISPTKPIQILRESTIDVILNYDPAGKRKQDPSSFAWNFSTALFYKANGKPWRLAKLRDDTCYVGISFYRDKLTSNQDIQTSMAQVFTHDGQGLVLRGTEVYVDEETKEPHLSEKQAEELLVQSIERYKNRAGRDPVRVVVHKSTLFTKAEKNGFSKAIGTAKRDYVTLSKRKGIRFMRKGSYPVLRGTLINLDKGEHLLYTIGYIPRLRTYPGNSIPQPVLINHDGDSEIKEICEEILGLTKLNWNTTAFCTEMPITLAFSKKVGEILSEADRNVPLQTHYMFYM
ncbi:MAG: hypothetical protein AABW79_00625 [Nanoarchaeota archaeon]